MKKIFSLVFFSLSLVGFCSFQYDDLVEVRGVYVYTWTDFEAYSTRVYQPFYNVDSIEQLRSIFLTSTFAFEVKTNRTTSAGYNFSFVVPSRGLSFSSGTAIGLTPSNCVLCATNTVSGNCSPLYFPEISAIYQTAASLFVNGYSGPGIPQSFNGPAGRVCVNVDFPALVSDVVSSTNTVFHSALLSSLSDVSGSLGDIVRLLGEISSRPSSGSSDVWTYDQITNFCSSLPGYYLNGVYFNTDEVLRKMDRSVWAPDSEGEAAWASYVDSVGRGLPLLQSLAGLASVVDSSAQTTAPNGLSSLGDQFNRSINNALTGSGSGGGIAGDIKRLSTNDWTKGVRDQLRDNHDSITNRLAHMLDDTPNSAGRAIRQTADNTAVSASRVSDIASKLNGTIHVQLDNPNNIGVVLDGPVTIDSTQFNGVSVPLSGLKDRIDTWYNNWYSFWDISTPAFSWSNFYNMMRDFEDQTHGDLSAITNSLRGVFSVTGDVSRIYDYLSGSQSNLLELIASSITNNWDEYYFKRFRRANEFNDEDDQPFTLEVASEVVFGRGFDEVEYSKLNWFSRVELLLFQLSAVSSGTNAIESVDIEDELNDAIDSFNQHGQDFVNASRRVVGVFQLVDGFAASMRAAFGSFSNPVTHGITLLPAGSWIGDHALVLEVSVTVQNALRLVFQCIWYLSAFVVAWRVVVSTWSRVVSFVRWLWSVFDI